MVFLYSSGPSSFTYQRLPEPFWSNKTETEHYHHCGNPPWCALSVSSVCSTESGFKPAKSHGAAASGHKLGYVSLHFLQVMRAGKCCCFHSSSQAQASHCSCLGPGVPGPFSVVLLQDGCAGGMGWQCVSCYPPIPSAMLCRGAAAGKGSPCSCAAAATAPSLREVLLVVGRAAPAALLLS